MTSLIYGAYGYTGELIARHATERDLEVTLAGRNGTKTRGLAVELGVDSLVFDPEDCHSALESAEFDVLLNCAGPFINTYEPIVEACLATGTHYLDITGEVPVFEAIAERDREAGQAGVCLLPGVGFDVVPTDCLACHLHDRLPSATHLRLGFESGSSLSGGTLATMVEHVGEGMKIRKDGQIVAASSIEANREIDFGVGPREAVRIVWGDLSTAYYTTGIENIEVYSAVPPAMKRILPAVGSLAPFVGIEPVKTGLQTLIRTLVDGPSEAVREAERVYVWGEATDGDQTVTSRLVTPESYAFTQVAATEAMHRIANQNGDSSVIGFQTPSSAFGNEFVLEFDGVEGFFDEDVPEFL